jgi:hypothetical protein
MPAETCPDRVENDVARELEEVGVELDHARVEPTLEDVTNESVAPVEPCCVLGVKALHAHRKIGLGCLEYEVVVVRHLAVRVANPAQLFRDASSQR